MLVGIVCRDMEDKGLPSSVIVTLYSCSYATIVVLHITVSFKLCFPTVSYHSTVIFCKNVKTVSSKK